MSGVYVPLWHRSWLAAVVGAALHRVIHSDIRGDAMSWVYISPVAQAAGSSPALHRVDPILIYTWRNAPGVYFSLWHKAAELASQRMPRSHSDICMEECRVPGLYFSLWHDCW
jgi:hypothetical protein